MYQTKFLKVNFKPIVLIYKNDFWMLSMIFIGLAVLLSTAKPMLPYWLRF